MSSEAEKEDQDKNPPMDIVELPRTNKSSTGSIENEERNIYSEVEKEGDPDVTTPMTTMEINGSTDLMRGCLPQPASALLI